MYGTDARLHGPSVVCPPDVDERPDQPDADHEKAERRVRTEDRPLDERDHHGDRTDHHEQAVQDQLLDIRLWRLVGKHGGLTVGVHRSSPALSWIDVSPAAENGREEAIKKPSGTGQSGLADVRDTALILRGRAGAPQFERILRWQRRDLDRGAAIAMPCVSLARKPAGVRATSRRRRAPSRKRARRPAPARSAASETRYGELVLVASDDAAVLRVLCDELDDHGYRTIVAGSSTPVDELAAQVIPILIVLDLDRRDGEGLALLSRIRERAAWPVIALSQRATEGDKVTALDAGADDYVTKPFGRRELFARIRVALRLVGARSADEGTLAAGPIQIDPGRHLVTVAGKPVHLTPIEFRILSALARSRGAVVTRDQLVREVWGPDSTQADHVRVHIAALRRKIEHDAQRPRWLRTVTGIGYRLGD